MNQLTAEEILNIQILLLESPGKTLTTLHKRLLNPSASNQVQILNQFDKKYLSPKLRKMIVANVQSTGSDLNSNLRAFSIIILKLVFGKQLQVDILAIIKNHLHSKEINFTNIINISKTGIYNEIGSLSDGEAKKIVVQFLHLLQSLAGQTNIQAQCKKYPLALQLIVIFWRTVLLKFKVPDAENYSKKTSTTAAYEILFEFLDIFFCKNGRLYLLRDQNLFIQNGFDNDSGEFIEEITFGDYYENEDQCKQTMLKNLPLEISVDTKAGSSFAGSNPRCVQTQQNNVINELINPFEMILPKGSSIFDSTHSHNTNRSLKGSSAFQRRNFNFSSNRSEVSFNLEDSQCDNPTPSFNQVLQDNSQTSFRPKDQSFEKGLSGRHNSKSQHYIMKQSATIMPVRNKILQSSLLEDLRLFDKSQKGSVQLQHDTKMVLGLKAASNQISGFETNDSPVNNIIENVPFDIIIDDQLSLIEAHHQNNKLQKFSPNEQKSMKRSHSEKNSMMKHSQIKDDEHTRQSLFSINCKKLKTSMQVNELDFVSEKKFIYRDQREQYQQNIEDVCRHTNYTCSCHSAKIFKNKIISSTYNMKYEPLNSNKVDFKKKEYTTKVQTKIYDCNQKTKKKLDDEFFKRLKAKKDEQKARNQTPKNKSDPKFKGQKSIKKPYFTKFSQFINLDQKSASKCKTPNKSQKPTKTNIFPHNFKKLDNFLVKCPSSSFGLSKHEAFKQGLKIGSLKSTFNHNKTFQSQKVIVHFEMDEKKMPNPRLTNVTNFTNSFEPKISYPTYSTHSTPVVRCDELNKTGKDNVNDLFDTSSYFEPVNQIKRKVSFNLFSPKSSNGFSKNEIMFYKVQAGKGQPKK